MSTSSSRTFVRTFAARWAARADSAGLIYGAIIAAAVLATVSAHADGVEHVALATGIVLGTYWMAHVYVNAVSIQFKGDQRHFRHRLWTSAGHETGVLKGGVPAIVVYLLLAIGGASETAAASIALYFSVVLLFVAGCLGAVHAGHTGRTVLVEGFGAGLFGVLMVVVKSLLH